MPMGDTDDLYGTNIYGSKNNDYCDEARRIMKEFFSKPNIG